MKKIISVWLMLVMFALMLPQPVLAQETNTIYYRDGSYLEMNIQMAESRTAGTKNGTKTYVYKNSDGVLQWKAVLSGTFTYTGTASSCTKSSCSVTIYDLDWYEVSKVAGKSGSSATCELTMGYKVFGITTKKIPVSMSLNCDVNGILS